MVRIAHAADSSVADLIFKINEVIINPLILLMFAVAMVAFIYGIVKFLSNRDNAEASTEGKSSMMWGIIGMFIMISVYAIMNLIIGTLGVEGIDPESGEVDIDTIIPTTIIE